MIPARKKPQTMRNKDRARLLLLVGISFEIVLFSQICQLCGKKYIS